MNIPLLGKRNSSMQEMGETREPMASDCWQDANRLAEKYSKSMHRDFWVLFAAKPHQQHQNALVMGWEVIAKKPPRAMVGVMVFKWSHKDQRLTVETDLSLPFDIPLDGIELSSKREDFTQSVAESAMKSGSILMA